MQKHDCTDKSYFRDIGKYFRLNVNGKKVRDTKHFQDENRQRGTIKYN
jgi:hypothetical protein